MKEFLINIPDYVWVLAASVTVIIIGLLLYLSKARKVRTLKLHNEEINELNRQMELVMKAAKMGTWTLNVPERMFDFNLEYLGVKFDSANKHTPLEVYYRALHPEDVPKIQEAYISILDGTASQFEEEYRIMIPGNEGYFLMKSLAVVCKRDETGEPIKIIGASIVI